MAACGRAVRWYHPGCEVAQDVGQEAAYGRADLTVSRTWAERLIIVGLDSGFLAAPMLVAELGGT